MDFISLSKTAALQRKLQAALGYRSGLDSSFIAYDTGLTPVTDIDGAEAESGHVWSTTSGALFCRADGYLERTSGGTNDIAVIDCGTGDVLIEVDLIQSHSAAARTIGVAFRVVDADTYLIAALRSSEDNFLQGARLYKRDGETITLLTGANLPANNLGSPVRLQVRAHGGSIQIFVDHMHVISYSLEGDDLDTYGSATVHGLAAYDVLSDTVCRWRNLAIWGI